MSEVSAAPHALDLARELPADPTDAAETRSRAAATVAEFTRSSALQALDTVLAADAAGAVPDPDTVRATSERCRLLDAEVARFRILAGPSA